MVNCYWIALEIPDLMTFKWNTLFFKMKCSNWNVKIEFEYKIKNMYCTWIKIIL